MGTSQSGAQDINNFRNKINSSESSSLNFDDLTYNGIFNEHFFKYTKEEDNEDLALDISVAKSNNKISDKYEYFVNVGLISKYDGKGILKYGRPKVKIVILLDISGSMSCPFNLSPNDAKRNDQSKLEIAKQCLIQLLEQMRQDDYLSIVLFDDKAEILQNLQQISEINKDSLKQNIEAIKARGGTDFSQGFDTSYSILNSTEHESTDYEKRVFILTDAQPNMGVSDKNSLYEIFHSSAQKQIYSTFFGVGFDFNAVLVEAITKSYGCSYYTVNNVDDFKKLLVEDFNYMVFPIGFDIEIITSVEYLNVYGSPNTSSENQGALAYIASAMPSNKDERGTKGGVILFKIAQPQNQGQITLKYRKRDGTIENKSYTIPFEQLMNIQQENVDFYQDFAIRKGVLLTRQVDLLKELFSVENNSKIKSNMTLNDVRIAKLEDFKQILKNEQKEMKDSSLDKEIKLIEQVQNKSQQKE